jgi:hypothetical protein
MSETPTKLAKDDFHRERSKFLDAFAGLEEALLRSPAASSDADLSKQLKALRSIRNDLVHSQLRFVQLDGQLQAVAINAEQATSVAKPGRVLNLGDFSTLRAQVTQFTREVARKA